MIFRGVECTKNPLFPSDVLIGGAHISDEVTSGHVCTPISVVSRFSVVIVSVEIIIGSFISVSFEIMIGTGSGSV